MKASEDRGSQLIGIRILVLGSRNVGKSAVTVRYLTRRYIGEYRSFTDLLYKQVMVIDDIPMEIEVIDISNKECDESFPKAHAMWADAYVIIYSTTDRKSLKDAEGYISTVQKLRSPSEVPIIVVANKRDLEHCRQIEVHEGQELAMQFGCQFYEVSAADSYTGVSLAFQSIIREARTWKYQKNLPPQRKLSLMSNGLSKMLGSIIRKTSAPAMTKSTVVICSETNTSSIVPASSFPGNDMSLRGHRRRKTNLRKPLNFHVEVTKLDPIS